MTEQYVADRWLQETLDDSEELAALVSTRIYDGIAPEGRTSPFVLRQMLPNAEDINTGMARRDITTFVYLVEGIADDDSFDVPHSIAAEIDNALHDKTETVNYGTVQTPVNWAIDCIRLRPHKLASYVKPLQVRQSGGFYAVYVRPA